MNKLIIILFLLIGKVLFFQRSSELLAQERIVFNPYFKNFLINNGAFNPAGYTAQKLQASLQFQQGLGSFSRIRDFYSELVFSRNSHTAGLKFYTEQKTTLFTKSKINGLYAYRLNLNKDTQLSFGSELGIANIQFDGSQATAGGSAWAFDFSVGALLKFKKLKLGTVIQQVPESVLRPIGYAFILERYYDISISYLFNLDKNFTLETGVWSSINRNNLHWTIDNILSFKNKFGLLFNFQNELQASLGAYTVLPKVNESFRLGMSFETSRSSQIVRRNTVSLFLLYSI